MSDKLNVRCNACVMESYGQSGCLPHVEGCPFVTDPIDKEAEAAFDAQPDGEWSRWNLGCFTMGYKLGSRAARSAAPVALQLTDATSELCKCGCPKLWHVPHHAHLLFGSLDSLCACYEFVPVAPSEPKPEAVRPTDGELIDELDSLLSDVHAGIGSEDAKQVKDSFRAYGQLRAKIGTLVTLTRASAVEPGEAEHLEEARRILFEAFVSFDHLAGGKKMDEFHNAHARWLRAERIRRAKR